MITYNDLYEALRKERYSDDLQLLSKSFLHEVFEYIEDKKNFTDKGDSNGLFSDMALKNKKKLENSMAIFKELLLRRRKKILNLAFVASETGISKKDFENLLDFEKELFEDIVKSLEKGDSNLSGEMAGAKVEESKYKLVKFVDGVEQFLDLDGEAIGPFQKGEVANLDKEIVQILVQDKKVEVLED
ncbi:DNA replication complex GINS family protein [Candidatus Pacearchaeota archaeon]|nr:DNA replication complex GINS family protein [Candidatus Pacearchaeota archaeon]